jgi:hypothetical protein
MKYWVKRNSGAKGPFSETQIEGFIESGRLSDGVLVSESPEGPWETFPIVYEDVDAIRKQKLALVIKNQKAKDRKRLARRERKQQVDVESQIVLERRQSARPQDPLPQDPLPQDPFPPQQYPPQQYPPQQYPPQQYPPQQYPPQQYPPQQYPPQQYPPQQYPPQQYQPQQTTPRKSKLIAFLLAFLFGPIGMFYSTAAGGIVMILLNLVLGIPTAFLILLITWPVGCIWAVVACESRN